MTQSAELEGLRVIDLMIPRRLEWDVEMLEELFVARYVAEIKCSPLSQSFDADRQGIMHSLNCWVFIVSFHRKENREKYGT